MTEATTSSYVFIFTGPHGAGRRTVAEMTGTTLGIKQVLTYTTRPQRSGETNGLEYHFVDADTFGEAEQRGDFIEVSTIDGFRYGVKRGDLESLLSRGKHAYLILNRFGADTIRKTLGEQAVRIFIYIDSSIVRERALAKGYSEEDIARYMSHYDEEMGYRTACEHAFENHDSSHTAFDLAKTLDTYLKRDLLDLD